MAELTNYQIIAQNQWRFLPPAFVNKWQYKICIIGVLTVIKAWLTAYQANQRFMQILLTNTTLQQQLNVMNFTMLSRLGIPTYQALLQAPAEFLDVGENASAIAAGWVYEQFDKFQIFLFSEQSIGCMVLDSVQLSSGLILIRLEPEGFSVVEAIKQLWLWWLIQVAIVGLAVWWLLPSA